MTEKTIPEILIPAEKVPVKITADICVIGGSCTGGATPSGGRSAWETASQAAPCSG